MPSETFSAPDVSPASSVGEPYEETEQIALGILANDISAPKEELDAQGEAMMHLISETPQVVNLGNELNVVEQPSTSVRTSTGVVTVTSAASQGAPVDINLGELTPPPPVDINVAELTPPVPVDINLAELAPVVAVDINLNELTPPTPVDIDITEKGPEVAPAPKEVPPDILASYQERFGINPEELKNMEGFADLSRGQQKQVLENLAQLTIGRIREEAVEGHDKDIALEKANASKLGSKFLGKVWVGMKDSFTKKFDIVNREKKAASEIQKGGMKEHEVVLKQMVDGMKKFGPSIKEGPDGALEVQFVETDGLNPDAKVVAESFNEQSTKLSKIPYEWSLDTATKEQQNSFKEAKEAYESTRDGLLMIMKESAGEGGEAKAVAMMAHTESQIEMQRFMQSAPDAAEELAKIEDQSAWTAAMKSIGAERGYYMAGGAIARAALGAMGGFVFAPAVAIGSAAIRGWRRTGAELVAQDAKQRKGEAPAESAKTAETKAMIASINESIAKTTDENLKDQLKMDLYELNKSLRGTEKNMITASAEGDIAGDKVAESGDRRRGATAKIDYLKAQIASIEEMLMTGPAADEAKNLEEKKAKLTAQLSRRLDYTKQKISEGKMVFGEEKERLGNQYALMRSMAEAEMNLATETAVDEKGDKVAERLARLLNKTDAEIGTARRNKKIVAAVKAGAIGGAFAGLGATATDLVKWMSGGDSAIRNLVSGARSADSVLGAGDTMEEIVDGSPVAGSGDAEGVYTHPGLDAEGTLMAHPGLSAESAVGEYVVKPGDTLTAILRAKFTGVTDTQIENLRSQDLSVLGIKNIDRISVDQKIDLDKIGEVLKAGKVSANIPQAGGEPTDFIGSAGEKEVYKNFIPETDTPRLVNAEDVSDAGTGEQVVNAFKEAQDGGGAAGFEMKAYDDYLNNPARRDEIAKMLDMTREDLDDRLDVKTWDAEFNTPKGVVPTGEVVPLRPSRSVLELTREELNNWPKNQPRPWPESEAELSRTFGSSPEIRIHVDAMNKEIGRYPSSIEYLSFRRLNSLDPEAAKRMLVEMKSEPLSEEALENISRKSQAFRTWEGTPKPSAVQGSYNKPDYVAIPKTRTPDIENVQQGGVRGGAAQEVATPAHAPRIIEAQHKGGGLEDGGTRGPVYEAKTQEINTQEAQALRQAEIRYQQKIAKFEVRKDQTFDKDNVRTINRGIGQLPKVIHGDTKGLSRMMESEVTRRLKGAVSGSVNEAQKLENARIAYQEEVLRINERFASARVKLEMKTELDAAKASERLAQDEVRSARMAERAEEKVRLRALRRGSGQA